MFFFVLQLILPGYLLLPITTSTTTSGEFSHENQKWCAKIGEYMFFGSMVGSTYYGMVIV